MANRAVIIDMRDGALKRIAAAQDALADRFGVEPMAPAIYEGRDPAFHQAREMERLADLLERVVVATDETIAVATGLHDALSASVAREIDTVEAALSANEQSLIAGLVDAMTSLIYAAGDDAELRDLLVDRGVINARETDGEWSTWWVGIDVDADDESAPHEPTRDLAAMSRAELNAYAATLGIEGADKLPNKAAVLDAIEERLTAPDAEATP